MKKFLMLCAVAALLLVITAQAHAMSTTDVFYTHSITPSAGAVSWAVDRTPMSFNWTSQSWVYSNDVEVSAWNASYELVQPNKDGAYGGVVYKFQSTSGQPMQLSINAEYDFAWWAGRKITMYFSDENNWASLSPMTGSRWAGWPEEFETNAHWQQLGTYASWSGGGNSPMIANATTNDGTFYIRVDLTTAGIAAPASRLHNLSFTGHTVAATAAVMVTETGDKTEVSETCLIDTYTVRLSTQPTSQVTIVAETNTSDPQILVKTGAGAAAAQVQLDFTPSNWNQPQTVTVVAIKDLVTEPTVRSVITHTAYSSDMNYMNTGNGGTMVVSSVPVDVINIPYPDEDVNQDCSVNFKDIKDFALGWLSCNTPDVAGCVKTW